MNARQLWKNSFKKKKILKVKTILKVIVQKCNEGAKEFEATCLSSRWYKPPTNQSYWKARKENKFIKYFEIIFEHQLWNHRDLILKYHRKTFLKDWKLSHCLELDFIYKTQKISVLVQKVLNLIHSCKHYLWNKVKKHLREKKLVRSWREIDHGNVLTWSLVFSHLSSSSSDPNINWIQLICRDHLSRRVVHLVFGCERSHIFFLSLK